MRFSVIVFYFAIYTFLLYFIILTVLQKSTIVVNLMLTADRKFDQNLLRNRTLWWSLRVTLTVSNYFFCWYNYSCHLPDVLTNPFLIIYHMSDNYEVG